MDQIVVSRTGNITYAVSRVTLKVSESRVDIQLLTLLDGQAVQSREITLPADVVEPALSGQAASGKSRLEDLGVLLYSALQSLGHIPAGQIVT